MDISESIRNDLTAFVERAFRELKGRKLVLHPYIEFLCHEIANCSKRHVVNLPPRHLKTTIGAICLSAWTLGRNPAAKIMVIAGGEELAEEISRPVRDLLRADWFTKAFPKTLLSASKARKMNFATTAGGGLFAASIHSNVTGFGADLIIVDDPLGVGDAANSWVAVKRHHFGTFNAQPEVGVILSIDPSLVGGSDCSFNVIQAWGRNGDDYLLIDQWRERCGYTGLRKGCLRMVAKHRPAAILVERTGNGAALLDDFHARHNMISIVPAGTKLDRFDRVSELIYSCKVLLNEDAPWREEFLDELTHFPTASTDDQADAATQALSWLRENPGLERPAARALGAKSGARLPTDGNGVAGDLGLAARALGAKSGAPSPTDGDGVARSPGIVAKFRSNCAPNGPFIQPKVWVRL
jgi:predicted phage terminase large subunit-like protein